MKSFDEFFEENFEDGLSDPSKYILKFTFEAGQQSKQAEVDELRKRIDATNCKIDFWLDNPNGTAAYVALDIKNILKGDQS